MRHEVRCATSERKKEGAAMYKMLGTRRVQASITPARRDVLRAQPRAHRGKFGARFLPRDPSS